MKYLTKIKDIVQLVRPYQWSKNLFIFLPLFFDAKMEHPQRVFICFLAFISFSLVASAIYCINDIVDVEEDRRHPEKVKRPVASGKVSKVEALMLAMMLLVGGISLQLFIPGIYVMVVTVFYCLLNVGYVLILKKIAIIDIICIASGFVLRVIVGGYAADVFISHWIVLMTFLLALFLACAKRRDDVLHYQEKGIIARKSIINYNIEFINSMMIITATVTIISYIMYTVDREVISRFNDNNYLYATSVFVMAGIFRYLQIAMVEEKSGNPTKVLLKDRFIQICIFGWIAAFTFVIYF